MTSPRITAALNLLPQTAHETAARIEEGFGKKAAARYLKAQLQHVDPTLSFKGAGQQPKQVLDPGLIKGHGVRVKIARVSVPAIETDEKDIWVPRSWLCKAMGWHDQRLTKLNPDGKAGRALAEAGYSFEHVLGNCEGCRRRRMSCISLRDAKIAVKTLQGMEKTHAA